MANLRDFYIKRQVDPAFNATQVEVYDETESLLQQLRMTLYTKKGEVLGEPDFGIEVEKYLFEFTIDPFKLTKEASGQINKYVGEARKRTIGVRPATYSDTKANRDIFVLLIDVPEIKNTISIFYD